MTITSPAETTLQLTDEQTALREMTRRLASDHYASKAQAWDQSQTHFPVSERKRLAELGLLGITLPEAYGGGGRPLLDALIVIEELAKANPLAAWPVFEATTGPARVIELFGTQEQKEQFLPAVAAGDVTMAISI